MPSSLTEQTFLTIRPAAAADCASIASLCEPLGYPVAEEEVRPRFEEVLGDPHQAVLVAQITGGEVIGWVHALRVCYLESAVFVEIGGLVVDPDHRRLGAGRALMLAAEAWAQRLGVSRIRLRSNIIRAAAHEFYRSIGYQSVKQQYTFEKILR